MRQLTTIVGQDIFFNRIFEANEAFALYNVNGNSNVCYGTRVCNRLDSWSCVSMKNKGS